MLDNLLTRVKAATGPDRDIDWDLTGDYLSELPYTSSVDAALALLERLLPGAHIVDCSQDNTGWSLELRSADQSPEGYQRHPGNAKTFPLAILAALLTALKEKTDG